MRTDILEIITEVSIYSVLIPIAFGIKGFTSSPFILKAFFVYLCYGGLVDITSDFIREPHFFLNSFTFFQVLFFTWFLYRVINERKLFTTFVGFMLFWCSLYVFCHLYLLNDWYFLKISSVFDTIAAIVISFIAAAALVILVKDDLELTKNPLFWFCLAIFGYTFCTYFIVSFITNPIYREKLWWIHNVANISAYLLYAYGYWVSKQRNASK
ncbi:MAG: hypothetical protein ACOVPB_03275 [Bacteroidia bacterium]|jgi:hypothetical protein